MFKATKRALLASVLAAVMATPAAAIPMTDTLFGEVTEILDPALALDYVVGTPASLSATWDTDDLFGLASFGLPDHAAVSLSDNPTDSSLSITLGSHTWTETDDTAFGSSGLPFLIFTAEGRLLGANFLGQNADGNFFAIFTDGNVFSGFPVGEFRASSAFGSAGVLGEFRVAVPEPATIGLLLVALVGGAALRRRRIYERD